MAEQLELSLCCQAGDSLPAGPPAPAGLPGGTSREVLGAYVPGGDLEVLGLKT
jgi:hypothetical protein